jgi:hypothetical protein
MRHLILSAALLLTLSACSTYQYMTIDSQQLKKTPQNQFSLENDTLRLTYNINGKGGLLTISIYNKTDQPLFVNWKKSALIRNQQTTSLFDNNILIRGRSYGSAYRNKSFAASNTNFTASLALPDGMDFIPPASSISKELPKIEQTGPLEAYIPDSVQHKKLTEPNGMNYMRYQQLTFSDNDSPIRFKAYLTFSLGSDNNHEFAETSSFYIGEVCQTQSEPEIFTLYRQQGDQLYVKLKPQ